MTSEQMEPRNRKQATDDNISRRRFCTMSSAALASLYARKAFATNGQLSSLPVLGQADAFVLQAPVGNPFCSWPRTLLSYPVAEDQQLSSSGHVLRCAETGAEEPFQISSAGIAGSESCAKKYLLFVSDLPAGATRTYRLSPRTSAPNAETQHVVSVKKEERALTITTGLMQIRIPASQDIQGNAPGPILAVSRDGNWVGQSEFTGPGVRFTRIETEEIEGGPIRTSHRISYLAGSAVKYIATVECVAGMDFVRLHENMEAMPLDAQGEFNFAWTGVEFNYRQGPNHPYNFPRQPMHDYKSYPWEKIAPEQMNTQFGVSPGIDASGKLYFALSLFEPWADVLAASFANFWSDSSPDAAAIFIDHIEQWNDHEYPIWHSSRRLAVEFVYSKLTLHFVFKIARGTRSTCLAFYDHAKDVAAMAQLEQDARGIESDGARYRTGLFPTSHALQLQNWHGTLDLDKTKDWSLSYQAEAAPPKPLFTDAPYRSATEFYQSINRTELLSQLSLSGVRQNNGFGPTSSRQILESWVAGYQIYRSQLSPAQRQRIEAIFLLLAYVHAGEDYMPMHYMLAGHPNFLSDVKSTPCGMAFLFPEHRAAEMWADKYEAFLRMNTRYHTRPAVDAWSARGGRWTENLGTYVWAFLRPASRGAFLLKARDGQERLCSPQLAQVGDWLVNALSAPFNGESAETMKRIQQESAKNEGARRHYWGVVSPANAPRRLHPPIGAHSERRKPPRTMWYLGGALRNYAPLTAEHLMWAARPSDQDMEATADQGDPYGVMYPNEDNWGTNPHLQTAKYTGYGITLRAAVDTPQELSIHMYQIDDGPNYRWGVASEGACGMVYFYANGKAYSHNGGEDAGDRIDQDTDFCTNFGVWRDAAFRSIGQNVLTEPLYDLAVAQFARIVPRKEPEADAWPEYAVSIPRLKQDAYSWPEYVSRSILLAGDDYFMIHDQVFNDQVAHRFSWFVRKGDDFPHITVLSGNPREETSLFTTVETDTTSGRWTEGSGDSLVCITHKESVHAERASFGALVSVPGGTDRVFLTHDPIDFEEGESTFAGTSGIIRERQNATEIALFHGTHIAAAGVSLTTSDTNLGISATIPGAGAIRGSYFAISQSQVEIGLPSDLESASFYVDGAKISGVRSGNRLSVKLDSGLRRWELTLNPPLPIAPRIERTEYTKGGAIIYGSRVESATNYKLELSADSARTWTDAGVAAEPVFTLSGLKTGAKYHVRVAAQNSEHTSAVGPEYPVYITEERPAPPDGLSVELSSGEAQIRWGQMLGAIEYRLYRKAPKQTDFVVVYVGRETQWTDTDASITAPAAFLGEAPTRAKSTQPVCEYYVTTVNHIGESLPSRRANTDPTSWRNWTPIFGERFRRTVELSEGKSPNDGGGRYYPS